MKGGLGFFVSLGQNRIPGIFPPIVCVYMLIILSR